MLPAPNLDDRHFQQLVDDARRLVQRRCPDWTDHNISDPGITLIETFAMMVDQLIYRLNRVPDRNYIKFLELLGLELRPSGVASGEVTFWLSAPRPQVVVVRAETEVATDRTDVNDPVVFSTVEALDIVPCALRTAAVAPAGEAPVDRTDDLRSGGFAAFSDPPVPGDALLVGLSDAVPSCAVLLRIDCPVAGVGVDPKRPPRIWEARTASGWEPCDLERDETLGFNQPGGGDVVLHVPAGHVTTSELPGEHRGWLRCRLLAAEPGQPRYSQPPRIRAIKASTIGGTARMVHARVVRDEPIGVSDGTAGQRFALRQRPVVPWEHTELSVTDDGKASRWTAVDHFASAGECDEVFHLDAVAGEVVFGPSVREPDGTLRRYGAVPPKSAILAMSAYRTGGGPEGNVGTGRIRVLKTSVPYISRVENRRPAVGGALAETIEDLKRRAPLLLRSRGRAVTARDFEQLTRQAAPEIARVHCLTEHDDESPGTVRVLVVPHVAGDELGQVERGNLNPTPDTVERIRGYLDERRVIGTRLVIEPPAYRGLTLAVTVRALPGFDRGRVEIDVRTALYRLLDPLHGGPDGVGWPMGHPVHRHDIAAVTARVPGVDSAAEIDVRMLPADPDTRGGGDQVHRLDLPPNGLVFSYRHQVRVLP